MAGLSWLSSFPPLSRTQQKTTTGSWVDAGRASPISSAEDAATSPDSPSKTRPRSPTPDSATAPQAPSPRPKAVQRVSSLFGLVRSGSASPPLSLDKDTMLKHKLRQLDWASALGEAESVPVKLDTWHNPTMMQMVETLQSVMMTRRDPTVPIPVE